jgi:hypothetical protein
MKRKHSNSTLWVALLLCTAACTAAVYEAGPGRPISTIPWATLAPGDTVLIHWRPEPYREKWVVCRQGTAGAPITIRGVPGPEGQLPVIDGRDAVTPVGLNFWNEQRGVIKIGGANNPPDTMPRHIVIENLEVRSGRPPYSFTGRAGAGQYSNNAAAIYVEKAEDLVIRGCVLHDSGNGLFIGTSNENMTRDVLVERNYIYDNGIVGSGFEHNSYTAALGIVFQFNRYGPLRAGAGGNNLKDRSAGLIVRYNWIEGGNRQLDLVDAEDSTLLQAEPRYRETHVYGNILIEPDAAGNRQIVHYGGDSGAVRQYRKGTLYFYNNTVVSTRTDRTTLFRLSTADERCEARNNLFYAAAGGRTVALLDTDGVLEGAWNWIQPGWRVSFGDFRGSISAIGRWVELESPGFVNEIEQDFRLRPDSPAVNAGGPPPAAVMPAFDVREQYVKHQAGEPRPQDFRTDVGAYEYGWPRRPPRSRAR